MERICPSVRVCVCVCVSPYNLYKRISVRLLCVSTFIHSPEPFFLYMTIKTFMLKNGSVCVCALSAALQWGHSVCLQ